MTSSSNSSSSASYKTVLLHSVHRPTTRDPPVTGCHNRSGGHVARQGACHATHVTCAVSIAETFDCPMSGLPCRTENTQFYHSGNECRESVRPRQANGKRLRLGDKSSDSQVDQAFRCARGSLAGARPKTCPRGPVPTNSGPPIRCPGRSAPREAKRRSRFLSTPDEGCGAIRHPRYPRVLYPTDPQPSVVPPAIILVNFGGGGMNRQLRGTA